MRETKFFKFHFKNDKTNKAASFNVKIDDFAAAISFAFDKLDQLNNKNNGYRIVGIYEILTPLAEYYAVENTTN